MGQAVEMEREGREEELPEPVSRYEGRNGA